jgi:hypothetical protein
VLSEKKIGNPNNFEVLALQAVLKMSTGHPVQDQ